jgi:hypothetical protein
VTLLHSKPYISNYTKYIMCKLFIHLVNTILFSFSPFTFSRLLILQVVFVLLLARSLVYVLTTFYIMEDKDASISTLQSLNLKLVKKVSKLRGEEKSKICLQNMCTYFSRDSGLIGSLMEEHQAQVDIWTTRINEIEEKFGLLNEHFLADLKEKEDIIACLQKDLQRSLASNVAFALLTATELPSPNFELHSRGFGSKLMHQMGYTGGGLGKNGHGIAHPIQPVMRPTKAELGFVGTSLQLASCLDILAIQTQFVQAK